MKPETVTINLSHDEIRSILGAHAQRKCRGYAKPVVTLDTFEHHDPMGRPIGRAVWASVRLTLTKE